MNNYSRTKSILTIFLFLFAFQAFPQAPNWLWANRIGSVYDWGYSVATDASGNVFLTGVFAGTADFDPGAGTFNMTSAGDNDIYICKLDANGNFVWAKRLGGTMNDGGVVNKVDPSGSGAVYTTGWFRGTADFDPGAWR